MEVQTVAETRWTPMQRMAIELRGCDILVSAAAGAGKTSVLVERLIRRILDPDHPLDLGRLLAVTFTEKAAAEMKQRIRASLNKAQEESPGDARVQNQIKMLELAQISTIHAFCLSIARKYFYKAGLDPTFRVLDDNEAELLRQDALADLFEEMYADEGGLGDSFRALVDRYGGKGVDEGLQDTLLRLHDFARTQASMDEWLAGAVSVPFAPHDHGACPGPSSMLSDGRSDLPDGLHAAAAIWQMPWMQYILAKAIKEIKRARGFAAQALDLCRLPGGPDAYESAIAGDIEFYESVVAVLEDPGRFGGYEEAVRRIGTFEHGRLGRAPKDSDPEMKELAKKLRDEGKSLLKKVAGYAFMRPPGELERELGETAPFVATLVGLVRRLDVAYAKKKSDRAGVDFSDLERYCLTILEQDDFQVASLVRGQFDCVLIDEYQDTNPLQERILSLIASQGKPGNRFMVGDLKQSIYRFRLAEPRIFLEKFAAYCPVAEGSEQAAESIDIRSAGNGRAAGARIDLTHNFRSRKEVLDSVNYLFSDFMRREVADIEYGEGHELRLGASYPQAGDDSYRTELHLVERKDTSARAMPANGQQSVSGQGAVDRSALPAGVNTVGGGEGTGEGTGMTGEGIGVTAQADLAEVDPASAGAQPSDLEEYEALEKEALVVAARIESMVDPARPLMLWDSGANSYRPCSYKDIAVLMRSTKDRANAVMEILNRFDIPSYADTGSGYFRSREVEVALSLLSVIDNPRQDIPLAAVLRSPIVGLSPADLARIRAAHKQVEFYDAARAYVDKARDLKSANVLPDAAACPSSRIPIEEDGSGIAGIGDVSHPAMPMPSLVEQARIARILAKFFSDLERWRTLARRRPLAETLWTVLRDTGYQDYVGGLPGGPQRQANLRALCDRAREFDSFGRHGLFRFLRFIEKIQEKKGDLGTARALGEQEDVVRVMSIHKAKGLEFPVVFAIDLGKQFNLDDARHDILFHRDLGIGPLYCDLESRVKYPTGLHQAISMRIRDENLAEEMRVLYVALTRAKEKLVMVGSARDLPSAAMRWARADAASAATYLDWICPALKRDPDSSPVEVKIWGGEEGAPLPSPLDAGTRARDLTWTDAQNLKPPKVSNPGLRAELERRLRWKYEYASLATTFAKWSVGEIRRRLEGEEEDGWRAGELDERTNEVARSPGALRRTPKVRAHPVDGDAGRLRAIDRSEAEPAYSAGSESGLRNTDSSSQIGDPGAGDRGEMHNTDAPPLKPLRGAARGIAVHALLSRMRLDKARDFDGVLEEHGRLLEQGLVESPGLDDRDIEMIVDFFAGPMGQSLLSTSGVVRRELPFTLRVPAGAFAGIHKAQAVQAGEKALVAERAGDTASVVARAGGASICSSSQAPDLLAIGSGSGSVAASDGLEDFVIVQGVIDVLVDEGDGLAILDFKTDDVSEEALEARFRSYLPQIAMYGMAAEKILKKPVKRASIVFLSKGRVFDADWRGYLRSAGLE